MRAEIIALAERMERKMAISDDTRGGSWRSMLASDLLTRLYHEANKLEMAIRYKESNEAIADECADVANFAMMIAAVVLDAAAPAP